MLKSLRAPERLFQIASWAVTFVFASFLIGLGGKLVADLPGVEQGIVIDSLVDPRALARIQAETDSLENLQKAQTADRQRAELVYNASSNASASEKQAFDNWIATRTATTDPRQDPEVVRRTRLLDSLQTVQRTAQSVLEGIDARQLRLTQALATVASERQALFDRAQRPYERARFWKELRVFSIRLILTLPLLLVAWWLVMKKRKSQYWPLARGFILFALFAFFFELVPYLPSYGGYVRYAVGIALTAVVGHYLIRAMQRYVARRAVAEKQAENERRKALGYEDAIKKMGANLCPGCERSIPGDPPGATNFCVHCGMKLYDRCSACTTRKNAFFQFCPACGVSADHVGHEAATAAS